MQRVVFLLVGLVLLFLVACTQSGKSEVREAALKCAENWLVLVDNGRYEESWEAAAVFFRNSVPKEEWLTAMQGQRKPLGGNLSRKVQSMEYRKKLPGAPDGEYVVIKFQASFENKKSAKELVTPMLDEDGTWRISGYFLK